MKKLTILLTMILMMSPLYLFAHSGHGTFQHSLLHYFTSPLHIVEVGLLVLVVGYFLVRRFSKKMK